MDLTLANILMLLFFPGGLFLIFMGLMYEWADRKLMAQYQNRIGPRWFQPLADVIKLLAKEEIVPDNVHRGLFLAVPVVAMTGALTAALYVPLLGLAPAYSFPGDLVVTIFLLSLMTICLGLAGANTRDRFSLIGSVRTMTQLFSYEAPFLLALLGPALVARSWQISEIVKYTQTHLWLVIPQVIGFVVAIIGLMGKLELPPFDAPEAETEIVGGALTEYSGRGLGLFRLGKDIELVVGLTLIAAFYLGGFSIPFVALTGIAADIAGIVLFFVETALLLVIVAGLQSLFARLRIDQTVGMWWRWGALLVLAQWGVTMLLSAGGVL